LTGLLQAKKPINQCRLVLAYVVSDGPLNFQGGLWFFLKKYILIPNVAEKNILILVEEKKII
jgi:hypothetical protein